MEYPIDLGVITGRPQFAAWFRTAHAAHQDQAIKWALLIIEEAAKLDGPWVDARNAGSVAAAKRMAPQLYP